MYTLIHVQYVADLLEWKQQPYLAKCQFTHVYSNGVTQLTAYEDSKRIAL